MTIKKKKKGKYYFVSDVPHPERVYGGKRDTCKNATKYSEIFGVTVDVRKTKNDKVVKEIDTRFDSVMKMKKVKCKKPRGKS